MAQIYLCSRELWFSLFIHMMLRKILLWIHDRKKFHSWLSSRFLLLLLGRLWSLNVCRSDALRWSFDLGMRQSQRNLITNCSKRLPFRLARQVNAVDCYESEMLWKRKVKWIMQSNGIGSGNRISFSGTLARVITSVHMLMPTNQMKTKNSWFKSYKIVR